MTRLYARWLLVAALGAAGCAPPGPAEVRITPSEVAVRVRVVRPERKDVTLGSTYVATIEATNRAILSARLAGDLSHVAVDRGDRVTRGQMLAFVRAPGLPQQIAVAATSMLVAQADLATQRDLASRAQQVAGANAAAIAGGEVMSATQGALTAEARVRAAAAETSRARALAGDARLVAPFDGVVVQRLASEGTSVEPGDAVLEVAQMDVMRVVVDVPERDWPLVHVGAPVEVTIPALAGRVATAVISRFAGALDPATRMLRAEIDLPNDGTIYTGLEARVRFTDSVHRGALTIAPEALVPGLDGTFVYVRVGDRAHRVPVRVGYDDGATVEIVEGLTGGEQVLLGAAGMLEEGARVEVAR